MISIVVPIYNEEDNVEKLFYEIKDICIKKHYDYEIIFVDDGSTDSTFGKTRKLYPLTYVRLRRNFGQTAAMDAGIKIAKGEYIITMDGDLQNDPADIPLLIEHLEENDFDVVSGWRKNRKDTIMKKFTSRVANLLRGIIVKDNIHDSGCSLKIYKKECFNGLNLYGEMHRFIPALLKIKGFTVGEVIVHHRPRIAGKTKYNWKRTFKGFVDMISVWFWNKYSVRPLHIMGSAGLICLGLGGGCGIWSIILFFCGSKMSNNIFPPLLTVFFIIIGLLMFVFGLMSDVLVKTYYGTTEDQPYSIKEIKTNHGENQ
ncbi:MAG: glycosyltransferase family 2 protein [Clostridia bacterium]|nr:glycosyltransferase family 2 protein [Clostridia bacterium]